MTAAQRCSGLLIDTSVTRMVVEYRDRLTRFGSQSLDTLRAAQVRQVEIVTLAKNKTTEDRRPDGRLNRVHRAGVWAAASNGQDRAQGGDTQRGEDADANAPG
jgi:hypothetical protein